MTNLKEFEGLVKPTWCPACGDFGILNALKQALANLDLKPHQVLLLSGIGCGSKLPHYMRANVYDSLHGRPVPVAQGAKLANHQLKVIVTSGDGDSYGIGANHFINAARRNVDIVHIVQNNQVYGLTKGQYSPTSDLGYVTTTSPEGTIEFAINPIALALSSGATFISRSFSGDVKHLTSTIMKAIQHKGYSLVDVLQPCVTFNKKNTYEWYRARIYDVNEKGGYDPANKELAWKTAQEWQDKIPVGVIYEDTTRPTYEEQLPALKAGPLVKQDLNKKVLDDFENLKNSFV